MTSDTESVWVTGPNFKAVLESSYSGGCFTDRIGKEVRVGWVQGFTGNGTVSLATVSYALTREIGGMLATGGRKPPHPPQTWAPSPRSFARCSDVRFPGSHRTGLPPVPWAPFAPASAETLAASLGSRSQSEHLWCLRKFLQGLPALQCSWLLCSGMCQFIQKYWSQN